MILLISRLELPTHILNQLLSSTLPDLARRSSWRIKAPLCIVLQYTSILDIYNLDLDDGVLQNIIAITERDPYIFLSFSVFPDSTFSSSPFL